MNDGDYRYVKQGARELGRQNEGGEEEEEEEEEKGRFFSHRTVNPLVVHFMK